MLLLNPLSWTFSFPMLLLNFECPQEIPSFFLAFFFFCAFLICTHLDFSQSDMLDCVFAVNEPRAGCVSWQSSHFRGHYFVALQSRSLTSDLVLFLCFATFSFDLSQFKMWFSSSVDSLTLWTSVSLTNLLLKEWIYVRVCWRSVRSSADERPCHPLCLVFSYVLGLGSPTFWLMGLRQRPQPLVSGFSCQHMGGLLFQASFSISKSCIFPLHLKCNKSLPLIAMCMVSQL